MARSARRSRNTARSLSLPIFLHALWDRSLVIAGTVLIVLAGLATAWLVEFDVLGGARAWVAGALGAGVFPPLALLILLGMWLLTGAVALPGRRMMRTLGVATLIYGIGVGVAGFFSPAWMLGSVDLSAASAGGDAGDWLSSAPGVVVMLALALTVSAIVTPRHTAEALRLTGVVSWISTRWLGTQLRLLWVSRPKRRPTELWEAGVSPDIAMEAGLDALRPDSMPAVAPHLPPAPIGPPLAEAGPGGAGEGDAEDGVVPAALARRVARDPETEAPETEESARGGKRRESRDGWILPPLKLLKLDPTRKATGDSKRQAQTIIKTLASFGVDASISQINEGPSVTQFGVEPGWDIRTRMAPVRDAAGKPELDTDGHVKLREEEVGRTRVRVNKITRLTNDLALALAAPSIRVEAPVPGQPIIGIEVPNQETRLVSLRGVIESPMFKRLLAQGGLPIALGRSVAGEPVAVDLTRMPHLLIAGATGSGKSVAINGIIASLITHHSPESLRLVLVDPKRVELTEYKDIPHLAFSRVVTDPEEVTGVLSVVVAEMERRYYRFQQVGARNIAAYNAVERAEGPLPFWVVILDELADLMMAAPVEVEAQLVRVAQLARATGIHLVIATQRPSVDVVTGLIKANFPTRIAFATSSQTDSRVILDRAGAEKLLGRGDMLFHSQDRITAQRVQGAFVSDEEISALIAFWTQDRFRNLPRPTLDHMLAEVAEMSDSRADGPVTVTRPAEALISSEAGKPEDDVAGAPHAGLQGSGTGAAAPAPPEDTMYPRAAELAGQHTRVSASLLQRRLRVGYPRAERLLQELERQGVVGPGDEGPSREVLIREEPVGALGANGGSGGGAGGA